MNWTRVCAQVISDLRVAAGKIYKAARACFMVHSDIPSFLKVAGSTLPSARSR